MLELEISKSKHRQRGNVANRLDPHRSRGYVPPHRRRCQARRLRALCGRSDGVRLRRVTGALDRARSSHLDDRHADAADGSLGLRSGDRVLGRSGRDTRPRPQCMVPFPGSTRCAGVVGPLLAGSARSRATSIPTLNHGRSAALRRLGPTTIDRRSHRWGGRENAIRDDREGGREV
jgi:hypothetical protein